MNSPLNKHERVIVVLLRVFGAAGVLAVFAIFLPHGWMNSIHEMAHLGTLPEAPIVSYLTRSLSAFYACFGVCTLFISRDIRGNHQLVILWGILVTVMGGVQFGIDVFSRMPWSWTLTEGPPTIVFGGVVLWLLRRTRDADR